MVYILSYKFNTFHIKDETILKENKINIFVHNSSKRKMNKMNKFIRMIFYILSLFLIILFFSQFIFCHIFNTMMIHYKKIDLTTILNKTSPLTNDDYNTVFLQTGLSQNICEDLMQKNRNSGISTILLYQNEFFRKNITECKPLCWWFVRTDILVDESGNPILAPAILDARPGDILLSFSTHSFGWRHGHAALVIDDNKTLESRVIGENSDLSSVDHFRQYSNYVLLRKKNISKQQVDHITEFAKQNLNNIPYRLCGSLFFRTYQSFAKKGFGVNCASLIWYAFESCGIDLDSDGKLFVTPKDIFNSDNVEIIQIYGIDPNIKKGLNQNVSDDDSF